MRHTTRMLGQKKDSRMFQVYEGQLTWGDGSVCCFDMGTGKRVCCAGGTLSALAFEAEDAGLGREDKGSGTGALLMKLGGGFRGRLGTGDALELAATEGAVLVEVLCVSPGAEVDARHCVCGAMS
jgi:hypothetical protein